MTDIDLLTVEDRVRLLVNALAGERDHFPVVKLFTPDAGATWLISEADPDEVDRFFALCDLGLGHPELGWVSLAEIKAVRGGLGLPVERELHFIADKPISAYAAEARAYGRIVA
ncbi:MULTISPECIES: DUF2958 domain-containing protein [unclassified Bradyrhizobium]|uniref:DUF2958 domain-containing protein n=1 Tax=unclassified Bradyrhizobium TaxID=2631580 RepID=UPI001FF83BB5|nr:MULTISPECIES: DUF2958 domain-containing protein [unclassified Bradyrhizobium]MCK1412471.1 DUF2958 domain-containing protein [Bradyrhizobium sp. CW4]UPJ26557.1 DUF2958 domain-containing protein [Bradyrhizobium sp. CW1]